MSSRYDGKDNSKPGPRHQQAWNVAASPPHSPAGSSGSGHQQRGPPGPGPAVTPGSTGSGPGRRTSVNSPPGPAGTLGHPSGHQFRSPGSGLTPSNSAGSMSSQMPSRHMSRLSLGGLPPSESFDRFHFRISSGGHQHHPSGSGSHSRSSSGQQRTVSGPAGGVPGSGSSGRLPSSGSRGQLASADSGSSKLEESVVLRLVYVIAALNTNCDPNPHSGAGPLLEWELVQNQMARDGFEYTQDELKGLWNSKVMSDMESIADFQFERKKSMYTKQADQKSKDGAYDWA